MNPVEQAFLADIAAQPQDDTPRLIYSDWLEEQGQGERAEFIRVQIELSKYKVNKCLNRRNVDSDKTLVGYPVIWKDMECGRCRWCELRRREQGLLSFTNLETWGLWRYVLRHTSSAVEFERLHRDGTAAALFRRGFIAEITLPTDAFLQHAADIIEAVPMLEEVRLSGLQLYPVGGKPNGRAYIRYAPQGVMGYSTPVEIYDRIESDDIQPVNGRSGWKRFPGRVSAEMAISNAALSFARDQLALRKEPRLGTVVALTALL